MRDLDHGWGAIFWNNELRFLTDDEYTWIFTTLREAATCAVDFPGIDALWGFGSVFRREAKVSRPWRELSSDVDIAVVADARLADIDAMRFHIQVQEALIREGDDAPFLYPQLTYVRRQSFYVPDNNIRLLVQNIRKGVCLYTREV